MFKDYSVFNTSPFFYTSHYLDYLDPLPVQHLSSTGPVNGVAVKSRNNHSGIKREIILFSVRNCKVLCLKGRHSLWYQSFHCNSILEPFQRYNIYRPATNKAPRHNIYLWEHIACHNMHGLSYHNIP